LNINFSCLRTPLLVILFLLCAVSLAVRAENTMYNCEVGLQLGGAYYVGDAARMFERNKAGNSFVHVREAFGAQARYRFDYRWSLQLKGQRQRIAYSFEEKVYENPLWNVDLVGEFNFFRFGSHPYDDRVKRVTPYVFVGAGMTIYNDAAYCVSNPSTEKYTYPSIKTPLWTMYVPVGIGVKWLITDHWQIQAAWQHQVYVSKSGDGIEGLKDLNNPHSTSSSNLNGINIMNNDLVSNLTVSVVYAFGSHLYELYLNESAAVSVKMRRNKMGRMLKKGMK